jgi:hypothetical protein
VKRGGGGGGGGECTFFVSVYEHSSKMDHVLGHKTSFYYFKKIEITVFPLILQN